MNRRSAVRLLASIGLIVATGCNASFWPGSKKQIDPYTAVTNGMSEKEVVKLLGEPSKRRGLQLEGTGPRALQLTWVAHNKLITVTLRGGQVIGKQKI